MKLICRRSHFDYIADSDLPWVRYLEQGTRNRATESTDMNEKSSRSHAIFTVILRQEKWVASSKTASSNPRTSIIEPPRSATSSSYSSRQPLNVRALIGQMEQKAVPSAQAEGEMITLQSKFHFVDLAGSERVRNYLFYHIYDEHLLNVCS